MWKTCRKNILSFTSNWWDIYVYICSFIHLSISLYLSISLVLPKTHFIKMNYKYFVKFIQMKVDRLTFDEIVKNMRTHTHISMGKFRFSIIDAEGNTGSSNTRIQNWKRIISRFNLCSRFFLYWYIQKKRNHFEWSILWKMIPKYIQKLIDAECVPIRHNYLIIKNNNWHGWKAFFCVYSHFLGTI